jgi:trimeric autotransporter adhesin
LVYTGIITTVAGNGQYGYSGEGGQATSAVIGLPQIIAVDASGDLYIADRDSCRIRVVFKSTGIITTLVGFSGKCGNAGDGVDVLVAQLSSPRGLAVDASGNIFISSGNAIRMVTKRTGIITTVAGSETSGFNGDGGVPREAYLNTPGGIAVDTLGNLYIADTGNNRIRKVGFPAPTAALTAAPTAAPTSLPTYLPITSLVIMTVAGGAGSGGGGDGGLAITTELY